MAFQDVADRLVAHRMAEVGERPSDAVVAPVAVLRSQSDNEVLHRSAHRGPTRIGPLLRPIELSGDQPPVPRQDRGGPHDGGHLRESLAAKLLADVRQGPEPTSAIVRFRAIWVIHGSFGQGVSPAMWTRRVATCITNKTS